jgi:hypothetical protein
MSVAVFNTYAFVKRLTAAGMPEAQAEVLADEQMHLIDERLATKEDIAKLEAATKGDIAKLEAATKGEIAKLEVATKGEIAKLEAATKGEIALLKHELTIRLGAMVMALGGFLVAIKFLGH